MAKLLTTEQMAEFANSGCLFFDELIDEQTNREFLDDIGHTEIDEVDSVQDYYRNIKARFQETLNDPTRKKVKTDRYLRESIVVTAHARNLGMQ